MTRQAIPLSTRYEVLCRQSEPEKVKQINRAGGTLKLRYSRVLSIAKCRMSGERLIELGCEFDHIIPVNFGGTNEADNIQALTPRAHRRKTDADIAAIAKTNRIQKKLKGEWRPNRKKIPSRGFDKSLSKKLSGAVIRRKTGE